MSYRNCDRSLLNSPLGNFIYGAMDQTPQIYDELASPWDFDDPDPVPNPPKQTSTYKKSFLFPTSDGKCPDCGSVLVEKTSKYGKFYGCSAFPTCSYKCSTKQYIAACKNPPKVEKKPVKEKPKSKLCPDVEYKGSTMSDPFGLRCGDCMLYSYNNNKCEWHKEWDVETYRPGCDMFISRDPHIRNKMLEYYQKLRKEET